jgi:predicted DCC family thiol-disulfide oxidoreductase YuxK
MGGILMNNREVNHPLLLFDGVCNICNHIVVFIIQRDPKATFRFASLQSEIGKRMLQQHELPPSDMNTVILINGNRLYTKSTAALHVFKRLGRLWSILYIFIVIPKPIRDVIYDWVARNRYKWFGKKEQCMLPTPEIKERFLD